MELQLSAALEPYEERIRRLSRETFRKIETLMPMDGLIVIIREAPGSTIPEIGLGGYNPDPDRIIISMDPGFHDFGKALEEELPFQLAHETHHAMRRRAVGYGSSLLQAVISEGLADHFAMEVTGKPAPLWSVALEAEALEDAFEKASLLWAEPYDHAKWFFGSTADLPRWAGYSMGFELVVQYLAENPTARASGLVGAEARLFAP